MLIEGTILKWIIPTHVRNNREGSDCHVTDHDMKELCSVLLSIMASPNIGY
jgi:hypothetical protein